MPLSLYIEKRSRLKSLSTPARWDEEGGEERDDGFNKSWVHVKRKDQIITYIENNGVRFIAAGGGNYKYGKRKSYNDP